MIKKISIICALLLLTNCFHQNSNGVSSGVYTSWFDKDVAANKSNNNVAVNKTGESCVTNVLGLVATGDSSVEAAKKNGGIKKVAFVDRKYEGFWFYIPFFQKGCTIVRGE